MTSRYSHAARSGKITRSHLINAAFVFTRAEALHQGLDRQQIQEVVAFAAKSAQAEPVRS